MNLLEMNANVFEHHLRVEKLAKGNLHWLKTIYLSIF